jgi:sorting nexin-29
MSKLIASRLQDYTENILGDYQCGFRPNRSTNDQIFTIRCLLEKCYEYNIPVHQLYIDYKMAYDSINRNYLYETLELFGIPNKLTRLIHMTLNRSRSKIKVQGEYSREFSIQQGLRQGDTLSCLLFNLVLERVIRNIKIDTKGTIKKYFNRDDHSTHTSGTLYSQPLQYLAYADDIALLGKNSNAIQQALTELEDASKLAGLKISDLKTKYMIMRRSDAKEEDREDLKTKDHTFERVETFKYLGSNLNENNELLPEIKERIAAGNRAYYSLQNILRSKNISKENKESNIQNHNKTGGHVQQ